MAHSYNPIYLGSRGRRISSSRTAWERLASPYLKNKKANKEAGDMAQRLV
jgi:hypothetical protein